MDSLNEGAGSEGIKERALSFIELLHGCTRLLIVFRMEKNADNFNYEDVNVNQNHKTDDCIMFNR